jgi:hypothetical protein
MPRLKRRPRDESSVRNTVKNKKKARRSAGLSLVGQEAN